MGHSVRGIVASVSRLHRLGKPLLSDVASTAESRNRSSLSLQCEPGDCLLSNLGRETAPGRPGVLFWLLDVRRDCVGLVESPAETTSQRLSVPSPSQLLISRIIGN